MVRLIVERIALHCICRSSTAIVIDNILVWVAKHIGAILTLLKFSCFYHDGSVGFGV